MSDGEFHPGDIVQLKYRGGHPERYVVTSERTGTNEWHYAYNLADGTVGLVQLLRGCGTTIRKLKKNDALILEVKTAMAAHLDNYCQVHSNVSNLL